jgi:hypothetical protein
MWRWWTIALGVIVVVVMGLLAFEMRYQYNPTFLMRVDRWTGWVEVWRCHGALEAGVRGLPEAFADPLPGQSWQQVAIKDTEFATRHRTMVDAWEAAHPGLFLDDHGNPRRMVCAWTARPAPPSGD